MKNLYKIYVKVSPKGLMYLGYTKKDVDKYMGSGLKWKRHLKNNNIKKEDIKTFILHTTNSKEEVKNLGEYYSNLFNVVESTKWANLMVEKGEGGATMTGKKHKPETIELFKKDENRRHLGDKNGMYGKVPKSAFVKGNTAWNKGCKLSEAHISKHSYEVKTPKGIFISSNQAAKELGISAQTVINRCKNPNFLDYSILNIGKSFTNA
jgi:Ni/Co efflux regulator RcnB